MKNIKHLLIALVILSFAIAQPIGMMNFPNPQMQGGEQMNERMEMMMTWKLTNDLDLTSEQADKFFPRMKEHRENMQIIDKEIVSVTKDIRKKIDDEKEITDKELDKVLSEVNHLEKQQIDEKARFLNEVEDILDTTQLAKLALFKQKFMKDLRKQIRKKPQWRQ